MYFSLWANYLYFVLVAILGYTCIWTKNCYHILVIGYNPSAYIYTCILVGEGSYRGGSISHWPRRGSVTLQVCLSVIITTPLPPFSKIKFFFLWGGVSLYLVYFLFTVETKINKDLKFHSFVIFMKWFYRDLILQNHSECIPT